MKKGQKIWQQDGGLYHYIEKRGKQTQLLEKAIYEVRFNDKYGFFLVKISDSFTFDYKLYGLEDDIIRRALKYYNSTTSGNMGILFNGLKGTGKTVSSKVICNKLNLPVIIVGALYQNVERFLNSIGQEIIIFVDEYEKIYGNAHDFLTIMDGVSNSEHRRVFMLTTNTLHIDDNLIDRPSRIRYLKKFDSLTSGVVEEIVDDILINKEHRESTLNYISMLKIITVDIVKAIIAEVNIQDESPMAFKDSFNATVRTGKFRISLKTQNGMVDLIDQASVYPLPIYNENDINRHFQINDVTYGKIINFINDDTIVVNFFPMEKIIKRKLNILREENREDDDDDDDDESISNIQSGKGVNPNKNSGPTPAEIEALFGDEIPISQRLVRIPEGKQVISIKPDFIINRNYAYGGLDGAAITEAEWG